MTGDVNNVYLAAFHAAPGELAVVAPNGDVMIANQAWRHYGEQDGAGPRGEVGANYWHLTTRAAVNGDQVAAMASDALEAVLGGHVAQVRLDYDRGSGPDERRFRLRVELLAGFAHYLVSHQSIADPRASDHPRMPRPWVARLS